ncbi:MAG: hypothetical protein JW716_05310 [Candidatus Aenigmarchaeota archaeon]|nr:hypothetical protein [Candidatus Aenigmarchaeota archaeon]
MSGEKNPEDSLHLFKKHILEKLPIMEKSTKALDNPFNKMGYISFLQGIIESLLRSMIQLHISNNPQVKIDQVIKEYQLNPEQYTKKIVKDTQKFINNKLLLVLNDDCFFYVKSIDIDLWRDIKDFNELRNNVLKKKFKILNFMDSKKDAKYTNEALNKGFEIIEKLCKI